MRDIRILIKVNEEENRMLDELSRSNTSDNASELIRSLLRRAYMYPAEFSLLPPKKKEPTAND